jgi:hypothetical protein
VTPPAPTPPSPGSSKTALSARLTGAGRQRLARALAHGVRLALALNQNAKASFQITIPLAQTKHHPTAATHRTRDAKTSVVLLRSARTLGAGGHAITLKLPRAAANRLAATGSLVVTVRVTVTGGAGAAVTRTVKVTLTR